MYMSVENYAEFICFQTYAQGLGQWKVEKRICEIMHQLTDLCMDPTEYSCLKALSLFSPGKGGLAYLAI